MRAAAIVAVVLLSSLFAAAPTVARADTEAGLRVAPETIGVDLDFSGADVTIDGTAPADADVVLAIDGPPESVKMKKQGKVMGLLWMTVEQAEVENMPSFHVVHSSDPIDELLTREEQVRLGVDPAATFIMNEARAVSTDDGSPLSEEKATEFVSALRDMYIKDGRYAPCVSCHSTAPEERAAHMGSMPASSGLIHLEDGRWETFLSLPSDTPLGDYSVQAYYVEDGQVVGSDAATFKVEKVGMVDSLGTMAEDSAPLYGAMSIAIAIAMGLTIGFVFRRGGSH